MPSAGLRTGNLPFKFLDLRRFCFSHCRRLTTGSTRRSSSAPTSSRRTRSRRRTSNTCEFLVGGVASEDLGKAKEAETFFNAQRADPYPNGLLDDQIYGVLFSLSKLGRGIQNALLLKPVRQGVNQDASTFCSYINTTGEIVVNSQSFEMLKALMWLAGFHEQNGPRGITIWTPIMKGKVATTIIKRLVGIEALKTGVNVLVKIETFKRSGVSIPAGCIMNPMLATRGRF